METDTSPVYETTPEHFKLFRKTFMEWVSKFGLTEWDIEFNHEKDNINGLWASVTLSPNSGTAEVKLQKHWNRPPTDLEIKRAAVHEFSHLLLKRLAWFGECRFLHGTEIDSEFESLARRFENAFYPKEED